MMIDSHKKREVEIPEKVIYNNPKCWEIYMAYIPDQPNEDSHVTSGKRPVIISSNRKGNQSSTEVNIYTLTKRAPKLPVHVRIYPNKENGLSVPSTVLIEQPDTISKRFLLKRLGSVDDLMTRYKLQNAVFMQHGFFTEVNE
ncbi:MAG: type II toxin-antitoxin system PemK/MazF family toxin [Anaerostipes sp.]|uniref:type II toxin-antitoxin system PemK/MazF family toxin n=1 Tax=Anaerostipes sp. TaxID=1872530 RepID=UPI003994A58E